MLLGQSKMQTFNLSSSGKANVGVNSIRKKGSSLLMLFDIILITK